MSKGEAKGVISNFIYNLIYQVVKMILPLITIPYVSRVLGAENLGIYNYTYSVAIYFAMLAYLGFENYGSRLIAQKKNNTIELNKAFTGAYCFQLLSSILAIMLYIVYMVCFCKANRLIAWIQLIYISSEFFNISWLYFGLERFKKTAIINIFVRLLSFIVIISFVKGRDDLPIYTASCASSLMISALLLWPGVFKHVRFVKVTLKDIWNYGKGSVLLFFPVLVISVYRSMDKIMLGQIASMTEVALYANADKIVEIPYGIITALGVVMIPRMTNFISTGQYEKSLKYIEVSMRFMTCLACAMAFGMMGVGKVFAPVFFGKEFIASGPLIMIIAPMVIIRACANVVRTQYLLPNKRDKDYIVSIIIGVFINLGLNSLLIPRWMSAGAAIATLFAESFVALYQIVVCRRDIPVVRYTLRNWYFVVAGAIMFVPVYMFGEMNGPSVSTLLIQIAIGVITYLIIAGTYLYKNEKKLFQSILNR